MATRFFEPDEQSAAPRDAAKRIALVVGNGAYRSSRLSNPPQDAALIARALETLGFETEVLTDADKPTLETAIVRLGERIERAGPQSLGFFYFAGHGIQHQGVNYMVPVGTQIPDIRYLKSGAVAVEYLVEEFGGRTTAATVIVLDACRDNRVSGTGGGLTRGLAAIQGLPNGTIVAFATAAGEVADDGRGGHSPYARALAARLIEPNRRLDEVFFLVAQDVALATGNAQQPALFVQGALPPVRLRSEPAAPEPAATPPVPERSAIEAPAPILPLGTQQRTPPVRTIRGRALALAAVLAAALAGFALWPRPGVDPGDPGTWPVDDDRAVVMPGSLLAPCPSDSWRSKLTLAARWRWIATDTQGPPRDGLCVRATHDLSNLRAVRQVGAAAPRARYYDVIARGKGCPADTEYESPQHCLVPTNLPGQRPGST